MKNILIILTLLILICALLSGSEIQSSCQNFPGPSFCPGGINNVIANGTDSSGCTIWICKSQIIEHYIIIDDNYSYNDLTIAEKLKTFLVDLFEENDSMLFSSKYRSNVSRQELENRIVVFIYENKALIIGSEVNYGIVLKDYPLTGNPAITEYLGGTIGIFVILRNSSELIYDDLREEIYRDCKNAGEIWQVLPSNRYNVCCPSLKFISVASENNGLCSFTPEYRMCSNCSNTICESWENVCNCQEDCITNSNFSKKTNESINCTDSDDGKNYYKKGNAITKDNSGNTIYISEDSCAEKQENKSLSGVEYIQGLPSCAGNNCYINEGYCGEHETYGIISQYELIKCPYGCEDGACIKAIPTEEPIELSKNITSEQATLICEGCNLENKCYPFGYRKEKYFCSDTDNQFAEQKKSKSVCKNNFECSTNSCINNKCTRNGFWMAITSFFKNLF
jgi:hypothetical protein